MTHVVEALFDGSVFHPIQPVSLIPNVHVKLTIEDIVPTKRKAISFLRTAKSLNLDGPPDWATHIQEYLYHEEQRNES